MADPMCAVEVMVDAQEREFALWTTGLSLTRPKQYEVRRGEEVILRAAHSQTAEYEMREMRSLAGMRAALRALAEMELPEEAVQEAQIVELSKSEKGPDFYKAIIKKEFRAIVLWAASSCLVQPKNSADLKLRIL